MSRRAQLSGDLVRGLEVGLQGGVFDIGALGGAGGVDIDGYQCLGWVDHDRAAGGQAHLTLEGGLDLALDLEAIEQGNLVFVAADAALVLGHHHADEVGGLVVGLGGVDQHLVHVVPQVVADSADDDVALLVQQYRCLGIFAGPGDGLPQLQQVVQVPLQLFAGAAHGGGAGDHAHAVGDFQGGQGLAQLAALVALDAAGDAAGPRVVGHQHDVAAGQADKGGQGRALVAALFLVDLDDDLGAFLDHVLDFHAAFNGAGVAVEVFPGDFLQRQEAVALGAKIHEGGFKAGFDPGDFAFVDVGFLLQTGAVFDVQIVETLAVDQRNAQLFWLSRIDEHFFHSAIYLFRTGLAGRESVVQPAWAGHMEGRGSGLAAVAAGVRWWLYAIRSGASVSPRCITTRGRAASLDLRAGSTVSAFLVVSRHLNSRDPRCGIP